MYLGGRGRLIVEELPFSSVAACAMQLFILAGELYSRFVIPLSKDSPIRPELQLLFNFPSNPCVQACAVNSFSRSALRSTAHRLDRR